MNPCKNSNNNQHNNSTESCKSVMEARLKYYEERIHILEDKLVKHEKTKAEVADLENQILHIQETIEIITQNNQRSFVDISQIVDSVSCKYKQTRCAMEKLKKNNDGLKCSIQKMSVEELALDEKIQKKECIVKQITEHNKKLLDKIHKKQECVNSLKQQAHNLEKAKKQKAEEVQKFHCNLTDINAKIECTSKHHLILQQRNNEKKHKLQELKTMLQEKEKKLEEVKELSAEKLAAADCSMEVISRELANTTAEVTDRKVKRKRAEMAFQKLKTANDTEACQFQAECKELSDQRDQLTCQLADAFTKLTEEVDEGRKLQANSKVQADRLAELEAEVDTLERRKCFMQSVMAMQRVKGKTETVMFQEMILVKRHRLDLVENELDEKKRTLAMLIASKNNEQRCGGPRQSPVSNLTSPAQ